MRMHDRISAKLQGLPSWDVRGAICGAMIVRVLRGRKRDDTNIGASTGTRSYVPKRYLVKAVALPDGRRVNPHSDPRVVNANVQRALNRKRKMKWKYRKIYEKRRDALLLIIN